MYDIYDCVDSFAALLDTRYHLVFGRKGVSIPVDITFDKKECYHLMGLQYLTDRPELKDDRGRIFDQIRERRITRERIGSSAMYGKIMGRVDILSYLEELLDSSRTTFKYDQKKETFSTIEADYLMKDRVADRNVFVFLSKNIGDEYFCRSVFPETMHDYARDQVPWTLLYKEKTRAAEGRTVILYDKLERGMDGRT